MTLADAKAAKLAGKRTRIRRDRTAKARSEQVGEARAADGPTPAKRDHGTDLPPAKAEAEAKPAKPKPRKRTRKKKT